MKSLSKGARFFPLLLLIILVVAAVGGVAAQDGVKRLVTGRQMGASDIPTLDPSLMQDVPSVQVASEFFPGLLNMHEETVEVGPGVATVDVSEDGTVFTFHIMDNIPWVHYNADSGAVEQVMDDSGNPRMLTAQDFYDSLVRTLDPRTAGPYQYVLTPWIVGGAEFGAPEVADADDATRQGLIDALGIKVIDEHTLEVTAPIPSAVTQTIFTMWVTWAEPKWSVDENGEFWTEPENIATYGPYTLKEWVHGDGGSLTMVKNPFWPGTPNSPQAKIDEVQFVFLDSEPQLANFEAGTLDVSEVPQSAVDRIRADATLSAALYTAPGSCTYYYGFNVEDAPFDDPSVRLAFSEAIDRAAITENITKSGQIPAGFFSLPNLVAAPTEADYPGQGVYTNVEDAKARWEAYLTAQGKTAADFSPTLVYNTSAAHEAIAQAVQQQWNDVFGVNVQLTSEDFATYLDNRGTFNVFRAGWCFDYPDTNNFMNDAIESARDDFHWTNPDFETLVDQALSAPTLQERRDLYAQAEHILVVTDAVLAPIYFYVTQDLTQPYVTRTHSLVTREVYEKWDINR